MAGGAAAGGPQEMSMPSMRCLLCDVLVRSVEAVQAHGVRTSHYNRWAFTDVALRGLVCAVCDERCGSERVADSHTKKSGHMEFIVKQPNSKQKQRIELVPPKVDNEVLQSLTTMGYTAESATRALHNCNTKSVDELITWLTDHKDDPDINTFPLVHATGTSEEWSNMVSDEMKVRSRKLRMDAIKRAMDRKGAQATEPPTLHTKRTLDFFSKLSEKMMVSLKKSYVIAEDLDEADLLDKINKELEKCDADKGVFSFRLPSRGNEKAYEYNMDLQQICLRKDKTYTCSTNSKKHSKKALRIGTLLLLIKELILKHESIRLRWVYYLNPKIYTNQDASDEAVAAVSLMFEATRSSFHIRPSPRGSIIGPILLCVHDNIIVNCTLGGVSGSKIPSEAEDIDMIIQVARVDFILVVEKETVFHKLSDMDFHKKYNCVIVTASGEPDVATRIVLKKLRLWLDVPIFALVDANPEGFDILCTYRFGSRNRAYDNLSLTLPDLIWIGVFYSDIEKEDMVPLEPKELQKLKRAQEKDHIKAVMKWRGKLMSMVEGGKKADIESVMKNRKLDDYIMERVQNAMKK